VQSEDDRRLVERMSHGWKRRVVEGALADEVARDLVRDVLRLDDRERSYEDKWMIFHRDPLFYSSSDG